MDFDSLLDEFTAAVESGAGSRLAALFCEDGVYHDGFYGAFQGREAIAEMLEQHFHGHAKDFKWRMKDPVCDGRTGYARYVFSYSSTMPEAAGKRVVFEGMARFALEDGRIKDYSETFDTGIALAQLGFETARLKKVLAKFADRVRAKHKGSAHLAD
jgi:uncharacterized protein (TIGR02246 family)